MPNSDPRHDRIGRFFTSDVFIFEEPARIRRTLHFILAAVLAGAASISLYAYAIGWMQTFRTAFAATISFVLVFVLMKIGYARLASIVMLAALLVAATYGVISGDGIHDLAIVVFPAVIILGSLLLNTPFFAVLTVLVIGCVATIGVLEIRGVITNKFSGTFEYPDVVILCVILAAEAVVIRFLSTVITTSLIRAHRSEHSYREIFNATSEAIFLHDQETAAILDVNEAATKMYGYSREEMLRMKPEDLTPDQFKLEEDQKFSMMDDAMREGVQVYEWLLRRKDGTSFWGEVTLRGTEIEDKKRILAVIRDVDARKRMEERLRQSEKLEAVGQLAGGVAHDFNNQLAGIVGYADLIRAEATDGSDLANSIDRILVAAKRASDLTSQLLAFARRGKHESAAVDIHALVDEVKAMLRHSVDEKIEVKRILTAQPSYTLGDSTQLQSAILNLAINARDAMPDGGTLTIGTSVYVVDETADQQSPGDDLPPGRYVQLEVADTGTGMDEETRQRIFEPFFTTKPRGKGTGMGLAAAYGTVRNHGGMINVISTKGKGSVFRILLPLYDGPILPGERHPTAQPQKAARAMVVDDDPEVCRMVSRMLEKIGYEATIHETGNAAVEDYRNSWKDVDLVLLDMTMPGMTGRDTFDALRQINPEAVVLLTSGFAMNEEVQELIDLGAHGFVQKPFSMDRLSSALHGAEGTEVSQYEDS